MAVDEGGAAAEEVEDGVEVVAEVVEAAEGVAVEDGAAVAADRGDLKISRGGRKRKRKGKCEEGSMMRSSMTPKARNWKNLEKCMARTKKMKIKNRIKMTVKMTKKTMTRTKKTAKRQRLSWYANSPNKSAKMHLWKFPFRIF
jgi:hypothetical protein